MKKIILTISILFSFSFLYSQTWDPPSLYELWRAQKLDWAVGMIKRDDTSSFWTSIPKYQYYKGLVYQSVYTTQIDKFQNLKDSSLFHVMDSYLKAFCYSLDKDSLKPDQMLIDTSGIKRKIMNINDTNIFILVIKGLIDSSFSQVMTLITYDNTIDPKLKQKYYSLFAYLLDNSSVLYRKIEKEDKYYNGKK